MQPPAGLNGNWEKVQQVPRVPQQVPQVLQQVPQVPQ